MSIDLRDETTKSWQLTGQELFNFVLKSSESLHNVINRAKIPSIQSTNPRKSIKRKIISQNKTSKTNSKKKCFDEKRREFSETSKNSTQSSPQLNLNYDFDVTSSSCEELNDIPMEELLSSPTWKQIVEQNSFVWPQTQQ